MSQRGKVLQAFKSLHKARKLVFKDDGKTLEASRIKINEEFKKWKNVNDNSAINELIVYSRQVEDILKTSVIQACEKEPGKFEARLRPETIRLDNVPYKDQN